MRKRQRHVSLATKAKGMFDEEQKKEKDRIPKKSPEGFRLPTTTWVAWIIILGSLVALMLVQRRLGAPDVTLSQYDFFQKFQSNMIVSATINFNPQTAPLTEISGKYYKTPRYK